MSESLFEAPSLIWDTMLNMANVEPELISDRVVYILSERCQRWNFLHF